MRKVKFSIKYVIICWVIIYLIISIFKFVEIKQKIYQKYGTIANKFRTTFYYNDSLVIDCGLIIVSLPAVLLLGGPSYLNFSLNNINVDKTDFFKTNISLKSDFLEKEFNIVMQHGEIIHDTFYDVLSTDSKFQHLYSDYIKEQIGLDDENIEFEFGKNMDGARQLEDINIDFSKIKSKDNYLEEIYKNINGYYLQAICVKNCNQEEKNDFLMLSDEMMDKYIKLINNRYNNILLDKTYIKLYYYDLDLINDKYKKIDKGEDNFYCIGYDNKKQTKHYYSDVYDTTWIYGNERAFR